MALTFNAIGLVNLRLALVWQIIKISCGVKCLRIINICVIELCRIVLTLFLNACLTQRINELSRICVLLVSIPLWFSLHRVALLLPFRLLLRAPVLDLAISNPMLRLRLSL